VISRAPVGLALLVALALPAGALGAPHSDHGRQGGPVKRSGALSQLAGARGCLAGGSKSHPGCGSARALQGPGPFMGSRAIAVSADGRNVYVASSRSDAIAVFARNARSGALSQPEGAAGCVAAKGADGCGIAIGLYGPNSVALSPDGRYLYATSRGSNSVTVFHRNATTGALKQLPLGSGCVSGLPLPGCAEGRALLGPDVVVVSPDGDNVYVGSFFGNAVATFDRSATTGALSQPAGSAGCVAAVATGGCASGLGLEAPEGLAIGGDGADVYVATALSSALVTLVRDPVTGALAQSSGGCIVDSALVGCTTGAQLDGANAVALSPTDGDVYVTSLFSDSVTSFTRASSSGAVSQKAGTAGCLVWLRAVGCSFGQAMSAPEGLAVSPEGRNAYLAAFATGAIDVLNRNGKSGELVQKPGRPGCLAPRSVPGCTRARALRGVSSIALSPDGRYLYSTSFGSNAVDIFRRSK
jgi:DNA-binding beta-propeller fold protein YncE